MPNFYKAYKQYFGKAEKTPDYVGIYDYFLYKKKWKILKKTVKMALRKNVGKKPLERL